MTRRERRGFVAASAAAALLSGSVADLAAQGDEMRFFESEAKIIIATQREQTPEQAPSIVTVVSRREIERYGARDLADILRRVPGFEFGVDVIGLAGLSFRGIWVHEGKSLLMIDGIAQNELGFGNYNFFGSIPASLIERVEIIRGPGSAIYGGFAELDVINVITHRPERLNGLLLSGSAGAAARGGRSSPAAASYGAKTDSIRMVTHVGYGNSALSRREYVDFAGNRLDLAGEAAYRRWQHVITEVSAKGLTFRYQRNSFSWAGQDAFTTVAPPVNGVGLERFNTYNDVVHLDYDARLSENLRLQPLFEYTRNNSFNNDNPAATSGTLQGSGSWMWRYRAEAALVYDAPGAAQVRLGAGSVQDGARSVASDGSPGLRFSANAADTGTRVRTHSDFGLVQYLQQLGPVGVTAGGRYESTSFGSAFAPRLGPTYVHEAFNLKLLYGRAFRIPLPWQAYSRQFNSNGGLRPETANSAEMELGYALARGVTAKMNAFFIEIKDPVVYQGQSNSYVNFGRVQSLGAEAELRADYGAQGGFVNIASAVPGRGTSPGFVTRSKREFLASPPIKASAGAYRRFGRFELASSATYLASRAGQSGDSANDPGGAMGTKDYPALVLADISLVARNIAEGLDMHVAVHNAFDSRYVLIQPYYGAHAPLPAQDREIECGATLRFGGGVQAR